MKKSITILALFMLMTVLTSFKAPSEIGGKESTNLKGSKFQSSFEIGGKESTNLKGGKSQVSFEIGGKESTNL